MTDLEYIKKYYKGDMKDAIHRLERGEPVQYIVGNVDFYGYTFFVNKEVLIPRFETEQLVEKTIQYIRSFFDYPIQILDIGTGSGCIAITLHKELMMPVDAVDISPLAIQVAKKNNEYNRANVSFMVSDIFENVSNIYDVIISNPPYIAYGEEIEDIVKNNEPSLALYADNRGLAIYERILKDVQSFIHKKAFLAFEIGYKQGDDLLCLAMKYFPNSKIWVEKDLQEKDRFLFIQIENSCVSMKS